MICYNNNNKIYIFRAHIQIIGIRAHIQIIYLWRFTMIQVYNYKFNIKVNNYKV